YKGFTIVNNAAGTDLVLGAGNAFEDGGTGQYTNATLASPANDEYYYEIWMVEASSYAPNGFYLYNIFKDDEGNTKKQYLNRRSAENLAFWTNGKDMGSTFIATKPRTGADILADAQQLYDELTAGANSAQIGYPNAEALAAFKAAIDEAAETYNSSNDANTLKEDLATAIEEVKSPYNVNYTPRTDVYYTIANTRGAIVYDPEKFENVDGDGKEFLWFWDNDGKQNTPVDLAEFDKENPNNQWGIYEKDGNYYLYNVGTRLFANVTINAAEGKTIFSNDDFTGCWVFSRAPAAMTFDAGDETWVAAPNVRIYGSASVTDEWGNENEDIYYMSISPSYTGPVINYYAEGDGGVPMNFTVAATEQNPEVTAAIEALFDPNGIETIDNGSKNIDNGAVYNLQGQRVKKAQKGVYIQNGKKVVLK
ncbi:MAG: hypothetical protein IKS72_05870, partial [Prevotella sp.]|nr:hypothetical protein [Prevotella sp.]